MVGAGMGGLAVAARLAAKGHLVTVYEQWTGPGGKNAGFERDGFRFSDRLYNIKRDLTQKRLSGNYDGKKLPVVGRVGLTNLAVSVENANLKPGDLIEFEFNPIFCGAKEIRYE